MFNKINNWINNKVFSANIILKIVIIMANLTLKTVVNNTGIKLPTVFVNVLKNFDEIEQNKVQNGITKNELCGFTCYTTTQNIIIAVSFEVLVKQLFHKNPISVFWQILCLACHEAFHACQLEWLLENKGDIEFDELIKLFEQYNANVTYENSVLEIGAYTYEYTGKCQNFNDLSVILARR